MKWYGYKGLKFLPVNTVSNYRKSKNLKSRLTCVPLKFLINYNKFCVCLYVPNIWKFVIFKSKQNESSQNLFFYSSYYFIFLCLPVGTVFKYDSLTHVFSLSAVFVNNFCRIYWMFFKNTFYSFSIIFFRKLKFKGKGYYIYKNIKNTVAFQFGYSHKIRIYSSSINIKFLAKTVVYVFGLNKKDIFLLTNAIKFVKKINIFTGRGIRFSKQIIYKKTGKVSTYC